MKLDEDYEKQLHRQLVKLGDMMGDGLHHEPDGKWISKEYRRILRQLGISTTPTRKVNTEAINKAMKEALEKRKCTECGGELKQTRSGSYRASCELCGTKYQFKKSKVKK